LLKGGIGNSILTQFDYRRFFAGKVRNGKHGGKSYCSEGARQGTTSCVGLFSPGGLIGRIPEGDSSEAALFRYLNPSNCVDPMTGKASGDEFVTGFGRLGVGKMEPFSLGSYVWTKLNQASHDAVDTGQVIRRNGY